ncbi:hypothetical protein PT277_05345 [Acetobacteraceae bacterium ESL0709]|nr:hypothetical protein [Acetobacteraceae bacterium ESL0697]MDF7678121.1 hypothetical protein [Acetobacteraceae bacterium ESL0709]
MSPTLMGFIAFVRSDMKISDDILPDDAQCLSDSYELASAQVLRSLRSLQPVFYRLAVYNLAAAYLIELAPDSENSHFFADFRRKYGLNALIPGIISSSSDNGTSQNWVIPDFVRTMTPRDLQLMKTVWGRFYLGLLRDIGPYRGLSQF